MADRNMEGVVDEYRRVRDYAERNAASYPPYLVQQSRDWTQLPLLEMYGSLLDVIPTPLAGKRVMDFGCKYGHLAPLLLSRGCSEVVGVDAQADYIKFGNLVMGELYPSVRLVQSAEGLIPLQAESVDVVIMNEVISHVNPAFLDTVWRETARVISKNGTLFISDGNNSANPWVQQVLPELYGKWENGPDGVRTDRDVVDQCYLSMRKERIREQRPELSEEQIELLAANTSGLFGGALQRVVDEFASTGQLIRRPYRPGDCPVHPGESGVVMERGFHPRQLELALLEYGFQARQLRPVPSFSGPGWRGLARGLHETLLHLLSRARSRDWYRSYSPGLQIVATKVR